MEPAHEGLAHRLTEPVRPQRSGTMGQDRLTEVERHVGVVGPVAEDHLRVRTLASLTNSSGAPKRSPQAWARRAARARSA